MPSKTVKDPALDSFPPVHELLQDLDLGKVSAAILASSRRMSEGDLEDAKQIVWEAAERWLVRDLAELDLIGLEVGYDSLVALPVVGNRPVKGYLDILAVSRGRLNGEAGGRKVAIDWKTTSNATLDSRWKDKHLDSHQWAIYNLLEPLDTFIYRGITRPQQDGPDKPSKCRFAEIVIQVPADTEPIKNHLAGIFASRQALIDGGFGNWPQNRPQACGSYGRDCPYLHNCPGDPGPIPADKSLSYSSSGMYQICPERYRRHVREGLVPGAEDLEETDATAFGSSCHRGLAEVYKQAFAKYK